MVNFYGMREIWFPPSPQVYHGSDSEGSVEFDQNTDKIPQCNIFMSREFHRPNILQNSRNTALVLIQGREPVRAGIWARSVCVDDDLFLGSMLPQINWARVRGFPVLVMNPNFNKDAISG